MFTGFLHERDTKGFDFDLVLKQTGPGCIVVRMALPPRNQLRGQVKDVKLGSLVAHVVVQVGEIEIKSIITRRTAEQINLKTGDDVTVGIRSTDVMIKK
jgi:molybdopterin-binding protein